MTELTHCHTAQGQFLSSNMPLSVLLYGTSVPRGICSCPCNDVYGDSSRSAHCVFDDSAKRRIYPNKKLIHAGLVYYNTGMGVNNTACPHSCLEMRGGRLL
ncbi:uncharacterized protein EKO05_0008820 [Ascochyta rabiei]|uniref:uncharacterized protein n=1 Tax=Didymella rabiei TaxID=5454 RepID=UPI0021F9D923|nr:uncharacterized protein EKO05_0008820 [Ascochyta rabiei]UPX18522.1 hypothetical protein EKO05_0008820 [Ascochyta rabiei]